MIYAREGYEFCRQLIDRTTIRRIRAEMVNIMRPYCDAGVRGPDDLDRAFLQIARRGGLLRGNVLKLCSRLASLPLLLAEPGIRQKVGELGILTPVIQAYSILCQEPFVQRFLFEPHQDLKERTSLKALAFWIPLSSGPDMGGLCLAAGSHGRGPLHHGVSERGHLFLPPETYRNFPVVEITEYAEGDCLIFNPYLVHWSLPNQGKGLRWTISLKIDEAFGTAHLVQSLHPFVIEEYIDTRSNEERIAEAEQRAVGETGR